MTDRLLDDGFFIIFYFLSTLEVLLTFCVFCLFYVKRGAFTADLGLFDLTLTAYLGLFDLALLTYLGLLDLDPLFTYFYLFLPKFYAVFINFY